MEVTKVLVLGVNGMLGHKLFLHLAGCENLDVYGTARNRDVWLKCFPLPAIENIYFNVNACNFVSLAKVINSVRPDWVINCIGIIKQSAMGRNYIENIYVNALFPHKVARLCAEAGARMLHISTDCVFSGARGTYLETDIPDALDLYGRCKLLGEVDYSPGLTLRTSIIGHEIQSRLGLIEWFLAQQGRIQGYSRHIYSGFPTIELANIIASYIIPQSCLNGVYHLSSNPISKYELLQIVAQEYSKDIEIEPFAGTLCDRSLDSSQLRSLISYSPPSWPQLIAAMHQDFLATPYGKR
ncbi:MAG: SDR family oxidoreductase [Syntrophomonadaceae bacterium]|nr:SDR family oxidoreductase [Syntrophomonadaceae bacterium]